MARKEEQLYRQILDGKYEFDVGKPKKDRVQHEVCVCVCHPEMDTCMRNDEKQLKRIWFITVHAPSGDVLKTSENIINKWE